jgi:biopolymer transport protein ExbB/TolQ
MSTSIEKEETTTDITNVIFINVKTLIFIILLLSAVIIFILFIVSIIKSYNFSPRGQSNKRRREHKRDLKEDKKEARKKIRRAKKQARQDAKIRRKKYK